jgi:hypothetical protein
MAMESFQNLEAGKMASRLVERVTRNHALEHATINVLSEKHKKFSAQGNSTPWGFHLNIFGPIDEEHVAEAVAEAHSRLKNGEKKLALHPNCGTVLLTTATLATFAAQTTFSFERWRHKRSNLTLPLILNALPATILAVVVALVASKPVGMVFQEKFTVNPELGDMEVSRVKRVPASFVTRMFQFLLGQSRNKNVNSFKVLTRG